MATRRVIMKAPHGNVKKRMPEEKAALLRQIEDLQVTFQRREDELNRTGARVAADVKANVLPKARAIKIFDDMMRERGLPEVQRREKLNQHFGVPLPPLSKSKK